MNWMGCPAIQAAMSTLMKSVQGACSLYCAMSTRCWYTARAQGRGLQVGVSVSVKQMRREQCR